jgi:glyoxylase-like metal-dependent hydrolase (beta-lactamase superfamily II)
VVVVDTGLPRQSEGILGALRALGRDPSEVRAIVLTHHHVDHTGNLAALVAATGAAVHVHPADADVVDGRRPSPGPSSHGALSRAVAWFAASMRMSSAAPVHVDDELEDGRELPYGGGMRVIHTPGHTAGHCSLLLPGRRLLIAGDAAGGAFGKVGLPLGLYTEDMDQARGSLCRLLEEDFDSACFGHGTVFRRDAHRRFERLAERIGC